MWPVFKRCKNGTLYIILKKKKKQRGLYLLVSELSNTSMIAPSIRHQQ